MAEDSKGTTTVVSAVAHLMVLFAIALLGFFFLVANAPLLADVLRSHRYNTLGDLIRLIITRSKSSAAPLGSSHFALGMGPALLSLLLGFMVQQVSGSVAFAFSLLSPKRFRLFSARQFMGRQHGSFKTWLHDHHACKIEWDWEFFNYCVYWGLFTNVSAFVVLCFLLVPRGDWEPLVPCSVFCLFLLFQCLCRSRTMFLVHEACLEEHAASTNKIVHQR